jgi:hypothetical protein
MSGLNGRARQQARVGELGRGSRSGQVSVGEGWTADILEVLHALARQIGAGPEKVGELRAAKAAERGGFADRVIWSGNR